MTAYLGLFAAAFAAATLLPLQSEAVLVGLLVLGEHPVPVLLAVATAGNVLGALVNWALGRWALRWQERSWFPVSAEKLASARRHYTRYGHWSLLLCWLPLVGDPLTLVAGVMREPLWRFVALVTLAKGGRYLVLTLATLGVTGGP